MTLCPPGTDCRKVCKGPDGGNSAPDLLLVDIVLPPGTPHDISVAGMARMHRPGLPVLYVTGYADHAQHVVAESTVLVKPVLDEALLASVAQMLESSGFI